MRLCFGRFVMDAEGRVHSSGATFLEAGAYDGLLESNTWFFERCLGWRGVLIEGQPMLSRKLLHNRPSTLNIREASCTRHGRVGVLCTRAWDLTLERVLEQNV